MYKEPTTTHVHHFYQGSVTGVQGDQDHSDMLQNIPPTHYTDDVALIELMNKRYLARWRPEGEREN